MISPHVYCNVILSQSRRLDDYWPFRDVLCYRCVSTLNYMPNIRWHGLYDFKSWVPHGYLAHFFGQHHAKEEKMYLKCTLWVQRSLVLLFIALCKITHFNKTTHDKMLTPVHHVNSYSLISTSTETDLALETSSLLLRVSATWKGVNLRSLPWSLEKPISCRSNLDKC